MKIERYDSIRSIPWSVCSFMSYEKERPKASFNGLTLLGHSFASWSWFPFLVHEVFMKRSPTFSYLLLQSECFGAFLSQYPRSYLFLCAERRNEPLYEAYYWSFILNSISEKKSLIIYLLIIRQSAEARGQNEGSWVIFFLHAQDRNRDEAPSHPINIKTSKLVTDLYLVNVPLVPTWGGVLEIKG